MKFKSYFLRMSLSFALIIGLGVFFGSSLKGIFLSNPYLNTLIITLTVGGVGYAFYQLFLLKKDCEVIEDLKQGQWSFSSLPQSHFLEPILSCVSKKEFMGDPALAKGLSDSLADRLENERVFPRYLIGLLVFLGLLGTFWGLSQTITSIAQLIKTMPSDAAGSLDFFSIMKESLQSPLSGMGTAFSSSLFGLGGSLLIGFLELQAGHAYGRFFNEVDLYLTTQAYSTGKKLSSAAAPLGFIQALLTRNVECIDQLTQSLEKTEKNERNKGALLDKLLQSLALMGEQNKTLQNLMIKIAQGQIELQNTVAALPIGPDEESQKSLQNIELVLAHSLQHQREDREEFLKKLREEMRLIAKTIGNLAQDQDRLAS
jgi:hypothetical protein